jgi:hypothetical protein
MQAYLDARAKVAIEGVVIHSRERAAPVVAIGVLAVEWAVGGHELLSVVDARVTEIKVRNTVKICCNVALLSRPLGLHHRVHGQNLTLQVSEKYHSHPLDGVVALLVI